MDLEEKNSKLSYDEALELMKRIDGESGEKALAKLNKIAPDFARMVVEFPFGEIYSRKGLDMRTREACSMAALAAMGNARPQLKTHIHGALVAGMTKEEIVEVFMHVTLFAGFPAALNAIFAAVEVFEEYDKQD